MLMQSHDEAVHLLPALPSNWQQGEITGLRARGGFEILSMKWEKGEIVSVTIRSHLGGNLRLRVHSPLKSDGKSLKPIKKDSVNENPFFITQQIARPMISEKANLKGVKLAPSFLYDIETEAGGVYTFSN